MDSSFETFMSKRADRIATANQLLTTATTTNEGLKQMKTVLRHLRNGDSILANRQPTLHKGSIMAHRARVIKGKIFKLLCRLPVVIYCNIPGTVCK